MLTRTLRRLPAPRLAALLAGGLLALGVAQAQPGPGAGGQELVPVARLSLDEAVALVRDRTGGRVVRADPKQQGERLLYDIRVLTADGRVRTYQVDAATGDVR